MRRIFMTAILAGALIAGPALAYEFTLQFTPAAGARGLVVAGYAFTGDMVMGNCSYYTQTGGSGRGGGYHTHKTYFNQTCYWDRHGNLLSVAQGTPTAPTPISVNNGLTVYAQTARGWTTGVDGAHGFVNVPSAQFAWLTPSGGYLFPGNQKPFDIVLRLQSIGDLPLTVRRIVPKAAIAKASVKSTTCMPTAVAVGATCTVVVTYDPSHIPGGDDPYTAYDNLIVSIVSNAGQPSNFTESIEVPIAPAG